MSAIRCNHLGIPSPTTSNSFATLSFNPKPPRPLPSPPPEPPEPPEPPLPPDPPEPEPPPLLDGDERLLCQYGKP